MEQFDQLLTCAICLDRYRNPKLLPCQHSFCMEPCMEGLVDYVRRQVKCPECRAEHRIPYNGIQGFPTNVTLTRFLELHMDITGELPDPTAGQLMERCAVCSEKSYCSLCVHCDKKVCADCKEAHVDILKREISRINNQIHRGMHRLHNALGRVEKNALHLQQNCSGITEEIDEIYRRLSKALRDRTESLKGEIERYLATEERNLSTFKDNLSQEISNIESNNELAQKHMQDDTEWDDCELMDAKDIFLRTMEFIRNFDYEPGDYNRRVRFTKTQSINEVSNTLSTLGELNMNDTPKFGNAKEQQQQGVNSGPGLMRSKSDHRLVTQFRQQQEEKGMYGMAYGGDADGGRLSPVANRRQFGERFGSKDKYGHELSPRYNAGNNYGGGSGFEPTYDASSDNRRSRFRSRFTRHLDGDSDNEPQGRSVRFKDENEEKLPRRERERVLDTEDVSKGPLSGITRLFDSPRVIQKLQDNELREKKKEKLAKMPPAPILKPTVPGTQPTVPKRAQRQMSEEDEIAKIKKQNRAQEKAEAATAQPPHS